MQYEMFKNFIDIAKIHYNQLVKEEAEEKAGKKHERGNAYNRWGSNSESIQIRYVKVRLKLIARAVPFICSIK